MEAARTVRKGVRRQGGGETKREGEGMKSANGNLSPVWFADAGPAKPRIPWCLAREFLGPDERYTGRER